MAAAQRVKLFADPVYLNHIGQVFETAENNRIRSQGSTTASRFKPMNVLFFAKFAGLHAERPELMRRLISMTSGRNDPMQFDLRLIPGLISNQKVFDLFQSKKNGGLGFLDAPHTQEHEKIVYDSYLPDSGLLLNKADNGKYDKQTKKAFAQYLYDQRFDLSFKELSAWRASVDWLTVFRTLDIQPPETELEKLGNYVLEKLNGSNSPPNLLKLSSTSSASFHARPQWLREEHLVSIHNQSLPSDPTARTERIENKINFANLYPSQGLRERMERMTRRSLERAQDLAAVSAIAKDFWAQEFSAVPHDKAAYLHGQMLETLSEAMVRSDIPESKKAEIVRSIFYPDQNEVIDLNDPKHPQDERFKKIKLVENAGAFKGVPRMKREKVPMGDAANPYNLVIHSVLGTWLKWLELPNAHQLIRLQQSAGVWKRNSEAVRTILELAKGDARSQISELQRTLSTYTPLLVDDLNEIAKLPDAAAAQELKSFVDNTFRTSGSQSNYSAQYTPLKERSLALLKKSQAHFSLPETAQLFFEITTNGAFTESDRFFRERLYTYVSERPNLISSDWLSNVGLRDPALRVEMAKVKFYHALTLGVPHASAIAEFKRSTTHTGSLADKVLEQAVWDFKVDKLADVKFFENAKGSDWRGTNPETINLASYFASLTHHLNLEEKLQLLHYFKRAEPGPMPDEIKQMISRVEKITPLPWHILAPSSSGEWAEDEKARRLDDFMERTGAILSIMSQDEKLPLIELTLHAGSNPLIETPNFVDKVMSEYLGLAAESEDAKYFKVYLDTAPEHERSVALSYKIAHADDRGSVATVEGFKLFRSVGVKAGQGAALWDLSKPEHRAALQSLKDDVTALSKYKILMQLEKHLSPKEYALIDHVVQVLGSASIKTVVEIKLTDGTTTVAALRHPSAEDQIRTHLDYGKRFFGNLQNAGLVVGKKLQMQLIDAMGRQIMEEPNFLLEAEKLKQAEKIAAMERMHDATGQWSIEVLGLDPKFTPRENILFMKKASGATFRKAAPDMSRAKVPGDLIVQHALRELFKYGFFNADSHSGNKLIDAELSKVFSIDYGQGVVFQKKRNPFRPDDLTALSGFLMALEGARPEGVFHYLSEMSVTPMRKSRAELVKELAEILHNSNLSTKEQMLKVTEAWAEHGGVLHDRFLVGSFKGLFTLFGEQYVSDDRFKAILKDEMSKMVLKKAPVFITNFLKYSCQNLVRKMNSPLGI